MNVMPGTYTSAAFHGQIQDMVADMHVKLKDVGYVLSQTNAYGYPIMVTHGSVRDDVVPEVVFGRVPDEDEDFLPLINMYRSFCIERGECFIGELGKEFVRYLISKGMPLDPTQPAGYKVVELDRDHFLYGIGVVHRSLYDEPTRAKMRVVQIIPISDDGAEETSSLLLETGKFGTDLPFERTAQQIARAKYLH